MHNKIDEKGKNKNFAFSVLRDHIIESILGKNVKKHKKPACLVYCTEFANYKYRFWPIFLYNFFTKRLKILVKVMEKF